VNTERQEMNLTLPDKSVRESPTVEDIAAAVAQRPRHDGWMLSLDAGGKVLSASIVDGEIRLAFDDEVKLLGTMVPRKSRALDAIDEALLQSVLESYGAGDGRWRQLCRWSTPEDDRTKTHWAVTLLIRVWFLVVIIACIPDKYLPDFIPAPLRGHEIWFALFPATVAGAITIGIGYYLNEKLGLFKQMASWTTGRATIVQSEILSEQRVDTYFTGKSDVSRSTTITLYSARVAYEYSVGIKRYFSTAIGLLDGMSDSDESAARAIVARYPIGAEVPVFYDPKHPSSSALERGMPKLGKRWILVGAGVVMLAMTLAIIVNFVLQVL
jgi:hypothetical protein